MADFDFYLASRSPRRAELLTQLGLRFQRLDVNVPEVVAEGESPERFVRRVAEDKARAGLAARGRDMPVLGADTAVVMDDAVLGKPADRNDAMTMLARLSGRDHRVLSAVAVAGGDACYVALSETRVRFRELSADECAAYWATGEPADKAGAYAIQGLGAIFVQRIDGSYSGVVGLPLFETARLLDRFGIRAV